MICRECGRVMPDTDKFCGRCGTPNPLFENAEVPVQEHQPCTQPDSVLIQEQPPQTQETAEPVQEQQPYTQENSVTAQQYQPYTQPNSEPVQEQPYTQESTEPVQEQQPYTHENSVAAQQYQPDSQPEAEQPYPQVNDRPVQEYRPNTQTVNEPTDMKMSGGKAKVKYTCSLTAVIICVVVIFLLSVACGVFAGLYFSVRPAAAAPAHSITQYQSGGAS